MENMGNMDNLDNLNNLDAQGSPREYNLDEMSKLYANDSAEDELRNLSMPADSTEASEEQSTNKSDVPEDPEDSDDLSDLFDEPELGNNKEPDEFDALVPNEFEDELADIQDILNEVNADKSDEEEADSESKNAPENDIPDEPEVYDAWFVDSIKRNASYWIRLLAVLLVAACLGLGYLLYGKCQLTGTAPEPVQEQPAATPVAEVPEIPESQPEPELVVDVKPSEPTSPYLPKFDFQKSAKDNPTDTLILLPRFEPIQAPWWSSGMACVQMVLDYWNRDKGDFRTLTKLISDHGSLHPGVCLDQIIEAFKAVGGFEIESIKDYANNKDAIDLAFLKQHIQDGIPVIIGWNGGGAHWQVLIGYDDMGTGDAGDDILITATPFDMMPPINDGLGIYEARSFIKNFEFYDFASDPGFIREHCFVAVKPVAAE